MVEEIETLNSKTMTIKAKIATDFLIAFKARETEKKNFLGLIKATIDTEEKSASNQGELTDESVIKILAKFEKNIDEVIKAVSADADALAKAQAELAIVKSYMPTKLTEAEIKAEVEMAIQNGATNIGGIMAWFKDKQADKKVVSSVANSLLNK
jgi:hypothetical protein